MRSSVSFEDPRSTSPVVILGDNLAATSVAPNALVRHGKINYLDISFKNKGLLDIRRDSPKPVY
jgi:hypothetical protein